MTSPFDHNHNHNHTHKASSTTQCVQYDMAPRPSEVATKHAPSVYRQARYEIIENVQNRYENTLNEWVQKYKKWLGNNKKGSTDEIDKLNKELSKLRLEVELDNKLVSQKTRDTLERSHGGVCGGASGCEDHSSADACTKAGCTWKASTQQTVYRRAKDLAQQSEEISDRWDRFHSSQKRAEQMQQSYRYHRKVFWIYVVLALALAGGFAYLYMRSYKTFKATGGDIGAAFTGAITQGVNKASEMSTNLKNRFLDDEDIEEGEEGEEEAEGEEVGEAEEGEEEGELGER